MTRDPNPKSLYELDKPKNNDEKFIEEVNSLSGEELGKLLRGPKGKTYREAINAALQRIAKANSGRPAQYHRVTFGLNSANEDTKE